MGKRFIVYSDEGLEGGPSAKIIEAKDDDISKVFPSGDGWKIADWLKISDMRVNESIYASDSGVTFTVMVWRVM